MRVKFWKLMNESGADGGDGGGGAATLDELVDTKVIQPPADKPADVPVDTKVIDAKAKPDAKPDAKTDVKADVKPDTKPDTKATWPDDWREKAAAGDEKKLARLQRYASPQALADALIAAQNRISSGDLKPVLSKDAKPEEIAQWRKENGIPETPDKYDLKFDSGLVIGDKDKPIVDGFLKVAHERNLKNEDVKPVLEWYYQEQERQAQEMEQRDVTDRAATLDTLNAEYGREFRANINALETVLSQFPEEARELLKAGRLFCRQK